MTPGEADELGEYLAKAMRDPAFRAAYEAEGAAERRRAADRLTALSEDLGLYDG